MGSINLTNNILKPSSVVCRNFTICFYWNIFKIRVELSLKSLDLSSVVLKIIVKILTIFCIIIIYCCS